jgi:hypothetical protein
LQRRIDFLAIRINDPTRPEAAKSHDRAERAAVVAALATVDDLYRQLLLERSSAVAR